MTKKTIITSALLASMPAMLFGQSALNAFQLSQNNEPRGTARFVSMAGAFGALGGDLSTLTQNPAGLGVYTGSEVGASLDIDMQRTTFDAGSPFTSKQTRTSCSNFGYVGSAHTGSSIMPFFSWGASYNRAMSFERHYRGYIPRINTSMTNYMAATSQGYSPGEMWGGLEGDPDGAYDPFFESDLPWLNLLGYNSFLFNSQSPDGPYEGLFQPGSSGDASTQVRQRGYTDEYSINFGGNFANTVYWGLGFGIIDTNFTSETYYDEEIDNARIAGYSAIDCNTVDERKNTGTETGHAGWGLQNYQNVSGTGFNMKFGLIFKPIQQLRFGLAIHTPTWYHLTNTTNAWVDYRFDGPDYWLEGNENNNPFATSQQASWNTSMRTPWRFMASVAGVVGGRFILSADYEYNAYKSMSMSYPDDGSFSSINAAQADKQNFENDVKQYYQGTSTFRLGAEVRLNRHWSVRAGYSYRTAPATTESLNGENYIYTSGTQPMIEFQKSVQNITCGIGYRVGGFYADAAFVHSTRQSSWQAFTGFPASPAYGDYGIPANAPTPPRATVTDTRNRLVLSIGYKF